ncbi:hypothetical protein SRHO_G00309160 [Serrasalmus rhombeus]
MTNTNCAASTAIYKVDQQGGQNLQTEKCEINVYEGRAEMQINLTLWGSTGVFERQLASFGTRSAISRRWHRSDILYPEDAGLEN